MRRDDNIVKTKESIEVKKKSTQKWPKVAIIILNWNGWKDTIECLESVFRIDYPNYQVIVVDNGSTDDSVEHIRKAHPREKLLETGKNLGWSGGNNVGIKYALEQEADYILLLNNDVKVESGTITAMVEVAQESKASIVGSVVKDAFSGEILFTHSRYPWMLFVSELQKHRISSSRWWNSDQVEGSSMLLSRELLIERAEEPGYFLDESLFLYCEEIEIGIWCKRNDRKIVIARDSIVFHKVATSSGGKRNPLSFYYLTRNRILLAHRYLHGLIRIAFEIFFPLLRVARAAMYLAKGHYEISEAILQGLADGFRGRTGPKL